MIAFALCATLQAVVLRTEPVIFGSVRDAESGRPLVGATVVAVDAGRLATSNAEGRYVLAALPAGPQHIAVRSMGHAPYALHAIVPRQGTLELNVSLQPLPMRLPIVTVRRERGATDRPTGVFRGNEARAINAADLARHPQLSEPDFLRAMAGGDVSVAPETPGGLHVRGGSADQTGYSIDGVPVFNPYHASDLMGGWNVDAFESARLSTEVGAVPALSGTLQLTSRSPGAQLSSRGGASTTHARVVVDGPLGIGQAGFLVSARAARPSFLGPSDDPTFIRGRSEDGIARVEAPARGGVLRAFLSRSADGINLSPVRPDSSPGYPTDRRNAFAWSSGAAALQWRGRVNSDSLAISAWRSSTGANGRWDEGATLLASRRTDYGLQATVTAGQDVTATRAGLRLESSETTYRVDGGASRFELRTSAPLVTAFGEVERAIRPSSGVGVGASAVVFAGRIYLAPTVRGRWSVRDDLTLTGRLSRRHQFAQSLRNTESPVGYVFPADLFVGARPGVVPVATGDEASLGVDLEPARGMHARVFGFARSTRGMVLVAPVEAGPFLRGGLASGSATARGGYAEAEVTGARVASMVRYGVQHVQYRLNGSSYVPAAGARTQLDGGVTAFPTASTSVRLGVTAASGRRVTPASGGFEWESCNLKDRGCEFAGSPRSDPSLVGAIQTPDYVRIDLGLRKHTHLRLGSRSAEVAIFGTYSNLLNRFNVLTYGMAGGAREAIEMRPQAPLVVGLDWRF